MEIYYTPRRLFLFCEKTPLRQVKVIKELKQWAFSLFESWSEVFERIWLLYMGMVPRKQGKTHMTTVHGSFHLCRLPDLCLMKKNAPQGVVLAACFLNLKTTLLGGGDRSCTNAFRFGGDILREIWEMRPKQNYWDKLGLLQKLLVYSSPKWRHNFNANKMAWGCLN